MAATIGLDLGGTKLLAGLVEADGAILACERRLIAGLSQDDLLATVADAVAALGAEAPIGAGVPAQLDLRAGVAVSCNHLPLDGLDVAAALGADAVDNDATCAMLGEWQLGAARGHDHVALVAIGTGIGGGLVLDGRVYRGASGAGAELGHMPIDFDGPACFGDCPGRGCLEALCSGSALARDATAQFGRPLSGAGATALAQAGDADAIALHRALGEKLGAGLAGIAMALDPELILLAGGVMTAGELILGPAREELRRRALPPARDVRIEPAALGEYAGMIGASLLVR